MTSNNTFIYIFVILSSIVGLQCNSIHKSTSQKGNYKSIYVDQFKLTYFRQVLVKGFNNSKSIQELIESDHSGFTESILTMDDLKLIDSLTTLDNQKMQVDSINRIGRVAEGADGKHPLDFIINKLNSKWLDSLSKKRYKTSGIDKTLTE